MLVFTSDLEAREPRSLVNTSIFIKNGLKLAKNYRRDILKKVLNGTMSKLINKELYIISKQKNNSKNKSKSISKTLSFIRDLNK